MSYFIAGWKLDGLIYSKLVVAIIANARAVVLLIAVRIVVVVNKCIVKSVSNLSKSYFLTIVHLFRFAAAQSSTARQGYRGDNSRRVHPGVSFHYLNIILTQTFIYILDGQ